METQNENAELIKTIKEQHEKDRRDNANNMAALVISLIAIFVAGKFMGWW